jgi:probable phosphoglycerate mutase
MTLYLVRHGETDWNREARLQGGTDTALNELGRDQGRAAGRLLRELLGPAPRDLLFVGSPLSRARETLDIVLDELGERRNARRRDDARLAEISFGAWEGRTWKEVRKHLAEDYARRKADPWAFAPPDGESYASAAHRVAAALAEVETPAVVVSHGGIMRVMLHLLAGAPAGIVHEIPIWQGDVLVMRDGTARWAGENAGGPLF